MANGTLVPSVGAWCGTITVGGVSAVGRFEIFPGGGVWQMLLGKPMLQAFSASHEYVHDTVTFNTASGRVLLRNDVANAAEGSRQNKVAIAHVSGPGECSGTSPLRLRLPLSLPRRTPVRKYSGRWRKAQGSRTPKVAVAHASGPGACNACLPSSPGQVPSSNDSRSVDVRVTIQVSYSARKRARVAAKKKQTEERARAKEVVWQAWREMEQVPVSGTKAFQ
ncbi:hypothetical protein C8R46DRAFT_268329 [Mycena filopes]|nr:hypothetical protein C8R46DRAFT_268329 [Mycena filopes]